MEYLRTIGGAVSILTILGFIFGFYFNTKNRIKTLCDDLRYFNATHKQQNKNLEKEMKEVHKDQRKEIELMKHDNGSIKGTLESIKTGQEYQKQALEEIKTDIRQIKDKE